MSEEKIVVRSKKDQWVAAEFELLKEWCPILEGFCKGTTLVYLQLQTGINRDETNPRFGKSWLSVAAIADRCNLSSPTVHKILNFLEEYNFLERVSGAETGHNNVYDIFPLPPCNVSEKGEKFAKDEDVTEAVDKVVPRNSMKQVFGDGDDMMRHYEQRAREAIELLESKDRDWNCNDMIKYFRSVYCIHFKGMRSKDSSTAQERGIMKRMIEEYSWETTRDAIKYAVAHWNEFGKDYPTLKGIYAKRESIVPSSQNGSNKSVHRGQHHQSNKNKKASSW